MFGAIARRLFGTANDRLVKTHLAKVAKINAKEDALKALSDEDLKQQTVIFRERLQNGETLDDLLEDAFATVREASRRVLGQRHYDVQLVGGMILHEGNISEMRTGEGKTLVATLPVYLNALEGKGVHVVTVNDYLAQRDAAWMARVYEFLGLSCTCITNGMDDAARKMAYKADITYATNNELGFDYLRDNMKYNLDDMVQRPFNYAIIDEVDSILIDEARTPLIISGPAEDGSELYMAVDAIMPELQPEHYELDEKTKSVTLTEHGTEFIENVLQERAIITEGGLYDAHNITILHHVNMALRAHKAFTKDKDYIVKGGKIVIIDEFTGRMMEGRRYSEGQHQAIEAKEKVKIMPENQTLASITFQNYFRMYPKLAGMTGTAMTEAGEFAEIYHLDVIEVPTNKPVQRIDYDDEIYRTAEEKIQAIADLIEDCHKRGQPVLVGTTSIEKSEELAAILTKKKKIKPAVLNARFHEQEAHIIGRAGLPGAVTIATNMAGRGTDIQLGGNLELRLEEELAGVTDADKIEEITTRVRADISEKKQIALDEGGLYVIGTERHESRRIDNQLRGRTGRQGDPGASKFFLSLEDDLMRIFGSERLDKVLKTFGIEDGEPITHKWVNKALEKAQRKVESHHFDIRKNLLKFDNVMNDQRTVIYDQRREMMEADDLSDVLKDMRHEVVENLVSAHIPARALPDQWDLDGLQDECKRVFALDLPVHDWAHEEGIAEDQMVERIQKEADTRMAQRVAQYGPEVMRYVEKNLLLQVLDQIWKEHLLQLEHLRQGISLRAYGQRDPLNEYKSEAFNLFHHMMSDLQEQITHLMFNVQLQMEPPPQEPEDPSMQPLRDENGQLVDLSSVGRNQPCPCGSGKKFKHCHGRLA